MKNILSIILAALLLCSCTLPALAVDGTLDADNPSWNADISHTVGNSVSGNNTSSEIIDISHVVEGGYLIKIPGSVAFTKDENGESFKGTFDLVAGDVRVPGTHLNISLTSPNYDDENGWCLTSARGDKLTYSVKAGETEVENNGTLLECANGTAYAHENLTFELTNTDAKTTSYSDTLTFNVKVISK